MLRKSGDDRPRRPIWRRCRTLRHLKQIQTQITVAGNPITGVRELLFSAAITLRCLPHAVAVFHTFPNPDAFAFNTLIRAFSHSPTPSLSLSLFSSLIASRHRPNPHTFPFLLRACSRLASPAGSQIHGLILKIGLESDSYVRNSLISYHADCGDLSSAHRLLAGPARTDPVAWSAVIRGYAKRRDLLTARKLFDECGGVKDLISWNVMITGYARCGLMREARELFDGVPERDVVSWNAMISGYVKSGDCEKALEVFDEMRGQDVWPDSVTLLSLLTACADSGNLEIGERLHLMLLEMCARDGGVNVFHGNTLIDMYAKCGCIGRAMDVFEGMKEKDVSTWNAVIGGLAFHGHAEECLHVFGEMLSERVRPDEITFVGVLAACSHAGMVEVGRRYFALMKEEYNIKPNIKHYGCMVDMLGRAGMLEEVFEFVDGMDVEPNSVIWRTLLGACRLHGNVELAKKANKKLLGLRQDSSGNFILLSNIYASIGEWEGAEKMRDLMDGMGVPKEAGWCKA